MKPYLWYSRTTSVTGKKLGEELAIPFGITPPLPNITHCICWGARLNKATLDNRKYLFNIHYLNPAFSVELNSNKFLALQKMKKESVNVPDHIRFNMEFISAYENCRTNLPFIICNFRHHGGRGL